MPWEKQAFGVRPVLVPLDPTWTESLPLHAVQYTTYRGPGSIWVKEESMFEHNE